MRGAGVWPSIRLELIRDGIEDYEDFHLLDALNRQPEASPGTHADRVAANRRLLALDGALVKSYKEYAREPGAYRSHRRRLAATIVAAQAAGRRN